MADADLNARLAIASQSKREVGKTAAGLIKPDQVVIIDGGTTALQLIKNLPPNQPMALPRQGLVSQLAHQLYQVPPVSAPGTLHHIF